MNKYFVAVLATAAALAIAPLAMATPVPVFGTVNTSGGANFSSPPNVFAATSTTFSLSGSLYNPGAVTPPPASGSLGILLAVGSDTVTDYDFSSAGITAGGAAGQEVISIAVTGGDTLSFYATGWSNIQATTGTSEGGVQLSGYVTESDTTDYMSPQSAILDFDANGLNNNFTEDITVTPEPSSLVLLGTGLLGLAFLAFRKAKSTGMVLGM